MTDNSYDNLFEGKFITDIERDTKKIPKENIFIDKIVKNTDTREYTDSISKSKILYGFINNKYLLITSGPNSFMDIKDSLINQNILR